MAETHYELMEAGKPKAPPISLIRISGDRNLITSLEAFGPNYFSKNVETMQKQYSNPLIEGVFSLSEPTTAESILAASYEFKSRAKPRIFDSRWLQAGRIVRTSEGVFANPPKDATGNPVTDEKTLTSYLKGAKPAKVGNGQIYIVSNAETLKDFAFAEYGSFTQGVQDGKDFAESGLARILEHTQKPARHLGEIASKENYPKGVNVFGFDKVTEPVLRIVVLYSNWTDYGQLVVDGLNWLGGNSGCAFGVLESAEGTAQKI